MTLTNVDEDEAQACAVPRPRYPIHEPRSRTPKQAEGPPAGGDHGGRLALAVPAVADAIALGVAVLISQVGWFGAVYAATVLLILAAEGLHRLRICPRAADQAPRVVVAAAVPLLLVPLSPTAEPLITDLRMATFSAGLLVLCRMGAYAGLRAARRHGIARHRTLIVGTGPVARRIADFLGEHPELGSHPVGFVDDATPSDALGLPLLGTPAALTSLVERYRIRRVIVCDPATSDDDLVTILRAGGPMAADVCVVPRMSDLGTSVPRACLDDVWGIPLIPLRRWPHTWSARLVKRCFDVVIAAGLLIILSPLLGVLLVTVACGRGGCVLFRQSRVTRDGALASIVKLRTVRDRDHPDTSWAVPTEHCTRLGRWLRSTHLDELPQLVNVLRGDMSLVGPRPERPYFANRFALEIPRYDDRHRVLGGMTGWAQVHGLHGDTSIPDRARFDNQYIEHWSPWLDLVILGRTLTTVLRGFSPLPPHPLSANDVSIQGGRL